MGGCGVASLVFDDYENDHNNKGKQILVGLADWLPYVGGLISTANTVAASVGTLNCEHTPDLSTAELNDFVDRHIAHIEVDMVRGDGEALRTLSALRGCHNTFLGTQLQGRYESLFEGTKNLNDKSSKLKEVLANDPQVVQNCKKLS